MKQSCGNCGSYENCVSDGNCREKCSWCGFWHCSDPPEPKKNLPGVREEAILSFRAMKDEELKGTKQNKEVYLLVLKKIVHYLLRVKINKFRFRNHLKVRSLRP